MLNSAKDKVLIIKLYFKMIRNLKGFSQKKVKNIFYNQKKVKWI